jgi:hypothetical protein
MVVAVVLKEQVVIVVVVDQILLSRRYWRCEVANDGWLDTMLDQVAGGSDVGSNEDSGYDGDTTAAAKMQQQQEMVVTILMLDGMELKV